jgi:hypothetical protein
MFTQFPRFFLGVFIVVGSACFAPSVLAGEGGVCGAASFNLFDNSEWSEVTEAAAAVAIGKTTAYARAKASGEAGPLKAFAIGTGGKISSEPNGIYIGSIAQESSDGLLKSQSNDISNDININVLSTTINSSSF